MIPSGGFKDDALVLLGARDIGADEMKSLASRMLCNSLVKQ